MRAPYPFCARSSTKATKSAPSPCESSQHGASLVKAAGMSVPTTCHVGCVCENGHLRLGLDHLRVVGPPCPVSDRREAAGPSLPAVDFGRNTSADSAIIIASSSPPRSSSRAVCCVAGAHRHCHVGYPDAVFELDRSVGKRHEPDWPKFVFLGSFGGNVCWEWRCARSDFLCSANDLRVMSCFNQTTHRSCCSPSSKLLGVFTMPCGCCADCSHRAKPQGEFPRE